MPLTVYIQPLHASKISEMIHWWSTSSSKLKWQEFIKRITVINFVYSGYYYKCCAGRLKLFRPVIQLGTRLIKTLKHPDVNLNNWNCISYLRHPISPEAFFNLITPSSSFSSSEGCTDVNVAVLPDTPSGEDGVVSSGGDPILMNDNPNCLSILKGWRQITRTRSHWLSSACLENAPAGKMIHFHLIWLTNNSSRLIIFSLS